MEKDEFNKLLIIEQVQIINEMIKKYKSATKAITSLGYNESTLRKRFKKNGYAMNIDKTAYISTDDNGETLVNNHSETKVINNSNTKLNKSDTKVINKNEFLAEMDSVTKEIQEFKNFKNEIYDMLEWYKIQKNKENIIDIPTIKINMEKLKQEKAITRGLKVYPSILQSFKDFSNSNKEYKLQDLMAMALIEYMDKYK